MEQFDLLRYAAAALEALGLRYFVTGSTATIFYGEPRFTNDIDLVVELPEARIADLCSRFPSPDFYVSEAAAREAVRNHSQFNIIHPDSGLKIDVMVPELDDFNRSRFSRSRRLNAAADLEVWFASPEDAILKKMEYFIEGGSEKHLRDIAGVLKISREAIDFAYVDLWAERMGSRQVWIDIKKRVGAD